MDTTPSSASRKRQSDQFSSDTPKSRKVSKGSLNLRNFDFTPQSVRTPVTRPITPESNSMLETFDLEIDMTPLRSCSTGSVSSDICNVTPVTAMSTDVRKRLNLFDVSSSLDSDKRQQYLSDLGKICELPKCLCAVGCLLDKSVHLEGSKSSILSELPDFLGYYKGPNAAKFFARMRKKLILLSGDIKNESEILFKSSFDHHVRMQPLAKDKICEICPSTEEKFTEKDLKSYVKKFYNSMLGNGKTGQEIHSIVSKVNNSILVDAIGDTATNNLLTDLEELRAESAQIRENLEKFQSNLNNHAALLYFATPIPHRQVAKLDQKLFCHPKPAHKTPDAILKQLPGLSSVQSSIPEDDLRLLFRVQL